MQGSHSEIGERVAALEERLRAHAEAHRELVAIVSGPPRDESLRGRVHVLEGESAAAKVASEALAEVRRERRLIEDARRSVKQQRLSWRWKLLGAITAAAVAVAPYAQMIWGS